MSLSTQTKFLTSFAVSESSLRFTPEARLSVREKRVWWEQHRDKAAGLFVRELAAIIAKLRVGTDGQTSGHVTRWNRAKPRTVIADVHRLVLLVIALRATMAAADGLVTNELTGPFESFAKLCDAWKSSACRPAQDGATDYTETNKCTCRLLDTLAKPHAAVVVLDQVIDDSYRSGGHIISPLREYAIALSRDDAWWLSIETLPVEMHGGALASNCCESHAGPPWYSFKPVGGRVVLQTGQDIWRTAKTTGGWQPFVEPHAIWSKVIVCDAKQCSDVPVAHCTKPAMAICRITGDRIQTGCTDAALTSFDLPR